MSRPRIILALIALLLLPAIAEHSPTGAGVIELCNLRGVARLQKSRPCRAGFLHTWGCKGPRHCGHANGCDWCPGCGECDCTCHCNPCCEMFTDACAEPAVSCCASPCDAVVSSGTPSLGGGGGGSVGGFFSPGILLAAIPPLFIPESGPPSFGPPGGNPPEDPPEDPPGTTGSPLVPEPASVTLWFAGASTLLLRRRKRRRR